MRARFGSDGRGVASLLLAVNDFCDSQHVDTCGSERLAECQGETRVPIVDHEACARQKAIADVCDVATHLTHPGGVGLRRDPGRLAQPVACTMIEAPA